MIRGSLKVVVAGALASILAFHPGFVGVSMALHIPAGQAIQPGQADAGSPAEQDRETVKRFLEQKLVRERLAQLGYSEADVEKRLSQLSDSELNMVATQIGSETPAGDGGVVITVLVIGVLALLFIYLLKRV